MADTLAGTLIRAARVAAIIAAGIVGPAAACRAETVAIVTDLAGRASLEDASRKGSLAILTEIAADAGVQLGDAARLTVVYLASGDEYTFTGPAQIHFLSNAPEVLNGINPQKRQNPLGKSGKEVTIRLGGVTQSGFVMRGNRASGRIKLLTLAGTKTLERAPEFR